MSKNSFFFKSGVWKSSRNMETVQPIKKNSLDLGPVWKSASKTLRSHNKIKKSQNMNKSTKQGIVYVVLEVLVCTRVKE